MDVYEKALEKHKNWQGKVGTDVKAKVNNAEDLTYAYTPGVAEPCKKIADDESLAYEYTMKANTIAVVSDGSAVLGLGNIGPKAAMPVMEGKSVLFKEFGGVNAVPIVLDTQDPDGIIETVKNIAPGFGGINLEDISSPRCVYIEDKLKEMLDIPVFHDDQHGTAIVTVAALINALKLVGKKPEDIKLVISGAGAAGFSCAKLIRDLGVNNIIVCDSRGAITKKMLDSDNPVKAQIAEIFNPEDFEGSLKEAMVGADVFVGVSAPNIIDGEDIKNMNEDAIVFAMANPVPEIDYNEAIKAGARVVATGRSDFPNQINNVLAFPGIFKGALDARASQITDDMKMSAAKALAAFVEDEELKEEYIIPSAFEEGIADAVAEAVKEIK
ncbi:MULTISPECIES: NADP-dependent malic enzyme [Anaerococcus]|uniref:NADP-dependent malic enzyme n=1 Tax=Anaerococcus nagyae TaxID=1755241 RepID=A0A3E2TKI1_9FIRM|nr:MULTISPECIES: NADP-dependent malic enzyme [Anaerococcus]MBP2068922.1 malate dehydrogenase (oxaloacetate-decarboxylating) [Anaerococcus nagyae]MDU1829254.1 NADP-dependent malic enzyme [Anaerococcus sp.]MDU1864967.1 NADP-dependent malic enzyme [Anaerococcus sp.]MDU2353027.1 NADP-dependent malic enzyme [Anaerococcus sp.]RGB77889.1 NADP-dependent malic enzyme [Anaerococcus nagyae]